MINDCWLFLFSKFVTVSTVVVSGLAEELRIIYFNPIYDSDFVMKTKNILKIAAHRLF